MMRRAAADRQTQQRSVAEMARNRIDRRARELSARNPETMSKDIAQFLNRGAGDISDDVVDAPGYGGYEAVRQAVGATDPSSVQPNDILRAVQGLSSASKSTVGRGIAMNEGPGLMEQLVRQQSRLSGVLAEDSRRGDASRIGVAVGAVGGSALGLTAAGQGLVALMDYIQQGTEAQSEREKPLG